MDIGKIVMTQGIDRLMQENYEFACEVPQILGRYLNYETSIGRVYIITEADRSYTTILLPSEY